MRIRDWSSDVCSADRLDGVLIYGGTLDEAVDKMRGTPGSPIKLTVVRPGRDKPFDVTVKREIIQLRPVKWEAKGQVGYININTFNKQTGEEVRKALNELEAKGGMIGYVVDLRGEAFIGLVEEKELHVAGQG